MRGCKKFRFLGIGKCWSCKCSWRGYHVTTRSALLGLGIVTDHCTEDWKSHILSDCQINLCEKSDSSSNFLFPIWWLWHFIIISSFFQVRTFSNSIQRLCSSEVTRYSWLDDASISARLFIVLREFLSSLPVSKAVTWQIVMTLNIRNFIFSA